MAVTKIKPSKEQWDRVNNVISKELYRITMELIESGEIGNYLTEEEMNELGCGNSQAS